MKKILSFLVLAVLIAGLAAPIMANAIDELPNGCTLTNANAKYDGSRCAAIGYLCDPTVTGNEDCGMCCLLNVVYVVTNWIFYLMMIAVVILFVVAGAKYMMSSGDTEKTKSAKNTMIYAIIGLVIALIAKLVPSVVKLIVAM